jgi:hypothetical protein
MSGAWDCALKETPEGSLLRTQIGVLNAQLKELAKTIASRILMNNGLIIWELKGTFSFFSCQNAPLGV